MGWDTWRRLLRFWRRRKSRSNGLSYGVGYLETLASASLPPATSGGISNIQYVPGGSPAVTTNPTNQTVGAGSNVSFAAAAIGVPAFTVQWQRSTNGGNTFTAIAGATSTTLTFAASAAQSGNEYQAVFTTRPAAPLLPRPR